MNYKCPKCGFVFEGELDNCPQCGQKLSFPKKNSEPKVELEPVKKEVDTNSIVKKTVEIEDIKPKSYWDGHLIQLIGWKLLCLLVVLCTIGIMYPWALVRMEKWRCKHQVYDGYRTVFDGHTSQLIGKWICWILLSIITCLIYAFWIPMKIEKWRCYHTHLIVDVGQATSTVKK